MKLDTRFGLPFIALDVGLGGRVAALRAVLVDTGSASTVLSVDALAALELAPQPGDTLRTIRGVGGTELVFQKTMDFVRVGGRTFEFFDAEIGAMDYGFAIEGILGMDFLRRSQAVLDLGAMTIEFASA